MRGSTWQVAAVGLLLAVLVLGGNPTAERAATTVNETDTITVQYDGTVAPNPDERVLHYYGNETVVVNNQALTEGTDYDWDKDSGELEFYDTANTTEGDSGNVTYYYGSGTETDGVVASLLGSVGGLIGLLLLLIGVGAVVKMGFGTGGGF